MRCYLSVVYVKQDFGENVSVTMLCCEASSDCQIWIHGEEGVELAPARGLHSFILNASGVSVGL
jgi:hypothetical protein